MFLRLYLLTNALKYSLQQPQRRQRVWYAPNVVPLRNLVEIVVVVLAVLGSEIAEALVT